MLSRDFETDFFDEQNKFMKAMQKHFDKELQSMSKLMEDGGDKTDKNLETEKFVSREVHSKTIKDTDGNPITVEHVTQEAKKIDKDGRRIQNLRESYLNTDKGIERTTETRRIGNKVYKTHSEKIGDQTNVKTEMQNLTEKEMSDFDKEWSKLGICCQKDTSGLQKALK